MHMHLNITFPIPLVVFLEVSLRGPYIYTQNITKTCLGSDSIGTQVGKYNCIFVSLTLDIKTSLNETVSTENFLENCLGFLAL